MHPHTYSSHTLQPDDPATKFVKAKPGIVKAPLDMMGVSSADSKSGFPY